MQRVPGTTGNGYDPPNVRQDYTGYQKDGESGLEFSHARYYNASHGRFTSPDPLPRSAAIKDPQTFNRFTYVLNSPYKFTDPLGLMAADASFGWDNVAPGFWGTDLEGSGRTTGRDIISAAEALYDRANYDIHLAKRANSLLAKGKFQAALAILDEDASAFALTWVSTSVRMVGEDHPPGTQNVGIQVIIWDEIDSWSTSRYGHVSYIIDHISFSWQNDVSPEGRGIWTVNDRPMDFITERERTSAGTGYVLDFGRDDLNERFKDVLLKAYVGSNPSNKDRYALLDNNCGSAFQRAINAIAPDLGIPKDDAIKPASHGEYIKKWLQPYIVNTFRYQRGSGGGSKK